MSAEVLTIMLGNMPLSFVMMFFYFVLDKRILQNSIRIDFIEKDIK
jgi:hypothetical protein